MYLSYLVDVPENKGKVTFRNKGNSKYVYYEYDVRRHFLAKEKLTKR
jgi:hypothetical protein